MIQAERAIARFRRDATLGTVIKWALVGSALLAMLMEALYRPAVFSGSLLLAGIGVIWIVLSYRSVKGSRVAADSPQLIAAGQFERAEAAIDESLRSFSLFRSMKLRTLHHLAILRHAQRRWDEAAMLCRALLRERLGSVQSISHSTRLILAESLLEEGDLRGAHETLASLYQQRLSLNEAVELSCIQVDYLARIGAWEQMMVGVRQKAQIAELLPAARSALCQALLALAAKKTGNLQWQNFLRRRAELIRDAEELVGEREILRALWEDHGGETPAGGQAASGVSL